MAYLILWPTRSKSDTSSILVMMTAHNKTTREEKIREIDVLWITADLGCDGDTIAITAAMGVQSVWYCVHASSCPEYVSAIASLRSRPPLVGSRPSESFFHAERITA